MVRLKRLALGAILFLGLALACEGSTPITTRMPSPVPTAPAPSVSPTPTSVGLSPRAFAFGVEYMVPGLAQIYTQAGARSTRPASNTFGWGNLEPTVPRAPGQHDYQWSKVDRYIVEYQGAGFNQIQIYTTANNKWASSKPKNHFPDDQFLDDYADYLFNLVERYDGDGERDAPGLKFPVLDYVIEAEWTEFFPGTTDEYLQLLTMAHRAVKRANRQARVWLVPLMMIDVFDRNPNADEIAKRAKTNWQFRHPVAETQKLLTHPELFDVIEIHSLGDYTELEATAQWLRAEMKKNGYEKPIFVGDALGISQFVWPINPRAVTSLATDADFLTFAPIRPTDALRVVKLLDTMKDQKSLDHDAAMRWFRAEHAKALVKKFVTAINAGYVGMNVWALADWDLFQQVRLTGNWFFMGMIDAQPGLVQWTPGAPRPAYYTLKLAIEKLRDHSTVEPLNVDPNTVAYRFLVRGKPIIVAWNEPGRIYFPGESEPTTKASLPVNAARATVTHIVTEIGPSAPRVETMSTADGKLMLTLDSTPVFVEPVAQ
jgi:hypothetical protein